MYMSKRDEDALTYRKANRNPVARKLREREFLPRVVPAEKIYQRKKNKRDWMRYLDEE
jgi:hypothetical protein